MLLVVTGAPPNSPHPESARVARTSNPVLARRLDSGSLQASNDVAIVPSTCIRIPKRLIRKSLHNTHSYRSNDSQRMSIPILIRAVLLHHAEDVRDAVEAIAIIPGSQERCAGMRRRGMES